ncbi:MAG: DASS family sodium-coupled anion symporter [Blastocatellia bacterium]
MGGYNRPPIIFERDPTLNTDVNLATRFLASKRPVMRHNTEKMVETASANSDRDAARKTTIAKWAIILAVGLAVALLPRPEGVTPQSWRLLAIFIATVIGSMLQPLPIGAMVMIGLVTLVGSGAMPLNQALTSYADPTVWLVMGAFFLSHGMVKTGLGRRIAFLFIRAIGRHALGLSYALVATGATLASVIPSTTARCGGIIFPIASGISEGFDSKPGETARRLGAFLMVILYQCEVIICAMFLTSTVANPMIAGFAKQGAGIELSYSRWITTAIVPALVSLIVVPLLVFRRFPPEIKHTPEAAKMASEELGRMGRVSRDEIIMLVVFALATTLWMTKDRHGLDYAVVALIGVGVLLLAGVIGWDDVIGERSGWDVFIWYGGLLTIGKALGESGITKKFAESAAGFTLGWPWWAALTVLLLVYFYAHYGFASITTHVTAMYIPFLAVMLAAGAPPFLAVLALTSFSNLSASLTHYGTTTGPIYFGAGYVTQRDWWRLGLIISLVNILIWTVIGFVWWKILGLW